ncbi:MAG: fluoride efflux transporter CrcB [Bacteroidota bacterium]
MKMVLLVGLGGFLGTSARYLVYQFVQKHFTLPVFTGTLLVNIIGSLIIGIVFGLSFKSAISTETKIFLATGFCGGFTTFSAFAFENLTLFRDGSYLLLALYILGSLIIGVLMAYLGYWMMK